MQVRSYVCITSTSEVRSILERSGIPFAVLVVVSRLRSILLDIPYAYINLYINCKNSEQQCTDRFKSHDQLIDELKKIVKFHRENCFFVSIFYFFSPMLSRYKK